MYVGSFSFTGIERQPEALYRSGVVESKGFVSLLHRQIQSLKSYKIIALHVLFSLRM